MRISTTERFSKTRRVNVTLPPETLKLIDRLTQKGNRSHFIDMAVHFYVKQVGKLRLRNKLQIGAIQRADRDLQLVQDWFSLEEEAWQGKKR